MNLSTNPSPIISSTSQIWDQDFTKGKTQWQWSAEKKKLMKFIEGNYFLAIDGGEIYSADHSSQLSQTHLHFNTGSDKLVNVHQWVLGVGVV